MKTMICCLLIVVAAILMGRRQGVRIAELESRMAMSVSPRVTKVHSDQQRKNEAAYRSKYQARDPKLNAAEIYPRFLELVRPVKGGNTMGTGAALQHREAMREILRLDFKELHVLLGMVARSVELKKTFPMQHVAASLCMIAMADADPQAAFDVIMKDEDWKLLFGLDSGFSDEGMAHYVIGRMALDDPGKAIEMLQVSRARAGARYDATGLLHGIAREDPGVALEYLAKTKGHESVLQSIGYAAETDDERTLMFHAIRAHGAAYPESMSVAFRSLCQRTDNRPNSRKWLVSLGLTDQEKLLFHEGICQFCGDGNPGEGDFLSRVRDDVRWLADFMPVSPERERMIWQTMEVYLNVEPQGAIPFLKELGFDADAMIRKQNDAR